jgi:serine protease
MRTARLSLITMCAPLLAAIPLHVHAQTVVDPRAADTARVIVKLKADSPMLREQALSATAWQTSRAKALGQRLGLVTNAGREISERTQVVFASGITSAELARRLAREGDVEYAVPDQRRHRSAAPNDPLYSDGVAGNGPAVGQWYLRAPAGAVKSSLDIEKAWNVTTGRSSVVVAVLDTGVRFDHPDLLPVAVGGKLLPGYDMIADVDVANDGDGRDADASDPGDWVTAAEANDSLGPFYQCTTLDASTGQYVAENSSWHGTQISGLIAALANNGLGMAGVGPNLRVLPVRVLGKCGGYDSDVIAGMRWAAGLAVPGVPANPNRAQVINLSLTGEGACHAAYKDAIAEIDAAGTVIVAAAGNTAGHAVRSPGNCDGVIGVAALRHVGTKVGFSDLGLEIAISAPGGNCVNTAAGSPCLYPILTTSNAGETNPVDPIYTDSFNPSVGTSFAAPLVAGTAALMLSAQPTMAPLQVRLLLQATARPFPTAGGDNGDGTAVPQCTAPQFDISGNPVNQFQCFCTIDTCGAGMLDAGAAVLAASTGVPAAGVEVEGLWWNAPGESESGWGINLAQQGNVIFGSWFTYDVNGGAWWLSMTADRTGTNPDTYTGQLIEGRGPAFSAVRFDPKLVTRTSVGWGTLTLRDINRGSFTYVVNGTMQTKTITRAVFGRLPTCVYGAQPNFAAATNYQDLWWNAPGESESGWGINLTHQSDNIFAAWFTYDVDGKPLWLSVTAAKTAQGVYSGQLIRTTGPAYSAAPFNPAWVTRTVVGAATFTFANGNAATFTYMVNGVTQTKSITRVLFVPPAGTVCQ